MSERVRPEPAKYETTSWTRYNEALKSRGALMIWLDHDLQWSGVASGKRDRTPTFSDAAIQFCLTIKGLFGLALHQAIGMVESLLKLAGLSWQAPNYSTVCRRQKTLKVRIPYRPASQGLHLLVDSTGLKMMGEGEWKRKKHGAECRRQWRKLHLGIDAETMKTCAVEVTPNWVGDAPMLPALLGQIDAAEALLSVSGDGTYDTKACHEAIALHEAQAIIPARKNASKPWTENRLGASARNEILRATQRLGRAIWKRWSGYTGAARSRPRCAASS